MSDQFRRTVSAPKLQSLDRDDDKTRGSQRTTTEGKIDSSGWNWPNDCPDPTIRLELRKFFVVEGFCYFPNISHKIVVIV